MSIRTRVIPRLGLIISVAWGNLTFEDFRGQRDRVIFDPRYQETFGLLFDLRRVDTFTTSAAELRAHADSGRSGRPRYNHVALLASSDLGFGLGRMYQAYLGAAYDDADFQVFREKTSAWQWLVERMPRV